MNTRNKAVTITKKNASKDKVAGSTNRTIKNGKKSPATVVNNKLTQQTHSTSSTKESTAASKKFESLMNKVNDLIKDGNIRQAYAAIPDETKFPENATEIKALKTDLMKQIWNL